MELRTMYPPQKDSPTTFLLGDILSSTTKFIVGTAAMLPQTVPFPLTLGIDKNITEVVMVTAVNTNNNELTVTRAVNAYDWPSGTKVARVFNAKDLSDLQNNIIDVNTGLESVSGIVTTHNNDISTLKTTVGGSTSGLVKGLADEIVRATNAENTEKTRAQTAEATINSAKPDRTELPQVITDWAYSADGTKLLVTITRYNASSKETTQFTKTLPIVSNENIGVMTPAAYNEITALRNDVLSLQQQGGRFIGVSFATKAALDSYTVPTTINAGDFTYILDDETHSGATTRWVYNGFVFNFGFIVEYDPIGIATTELLGLVKSEKISGGAIDWTARPSIVDNQWHSICYENGLFVAVSIDGTGDHIMTSPDGINWSTRVSPANNNWRSVCYGNGLFVAVASSGSGTRVMTSPDSINWTLRSAAALNSWYSVCYGNGLFVAVAISGTGNRVMTSPDGINWTARSSAADNEWRSVCYGNGLFVAVAGSGTGNRVMTSPDGINWTARSSAANNPWRSVCYGDGLFVAVAAGSSIGDRVMTSPDGINWTIRSSAADNAWASVCYGNGLFVAVAGSGTGNRVMTSPDGINWTIRSSAADNAWNSVCYGNRLFVAVAGTSISNRVMTSPITFNNGKTFVEIDGTMSVIGWDELNIAVSERVPQSRLINNKSLTSDVILTASDVGAITTAISANLVAASWSGEGPYTQNVTVTGMTAAKNATVGLAPTATQEQREVAREAILQATAQTTNQITVTADGDKPLIDIPVVVILMP